VIINSISTNIKLHLPTSKFIVDTKSAFTIGIDNIWVSWLWYCWSCFKAAGIQPIVPPVRLDLEMEESLAMLIVLSCWPSAGFFETHHHGYQDSAGIVNLPELFENKGSNNSSSTFKATCLKNKLCHALICSYNCSAHSERKELGLLKALS